MKIFLDPGHGGTDPGAVAHGFLEKDIALGITLRLGARLVSAGYNVQYSRIEDIYVGLTHRCRLANAWMADLFVSIHMNADEDPDLPGMHEARGEEIWIYPGATTARAVAESVAQSIKERFPDEPFRGIKEDDLAVVRMTTMPAILIEAGFIDNSDTARRLSHPTTQNEFAAAVATGLCRWAERHRINLN